MGWEEDQDKLLLPAYLHLLPPEEIFRELKRLSSKVEVWEAPYKEFEPDLFNRAEPLIDLALAAYGTNEEVFAALYQRALEPPVDSLDEQRKHSLRVAGLSNQVLSKAQFMFEFPKDIVGEEEVYRILAAGTEDETKALLCNPELSAKLLEDIFSLNGLIADLPEDRQRRIVYQAAENSRIGIVKESDDSPDLEHYRIHKAIFRLLEVAPADLKWRWVVDAALSSVDPSRSCLPDRVDHVIEKWRRLKFPKSKDDPTEQEGYFTDLPRGEELACLIAGLYGSTYKDGKSGCIGTANSKDVVLRCAYYANATLTDKEMKAGYERDGNTYLYAACLNLGIKTDRQRRKLFEEEQLNGDLRPLYTKYLRLAEKRYPYLKRMGSELFQEDEKPSSTEEKVDTLQTTVTSIKNSLDSLQSSFQSARVTAFILLIAVAVGYWMKR